MYKISRTVIVEQRINSEVKLTLIHAFVSSHLDYCNSLLYGIPQYQMNRLQRVLNAAARVTCRLPRFAHVTTGAALFRLHRLPIKYRILYKIALLTFKVSKGWLHPSYQTYLLYRLRVTIHSEEIASYYSSPYSPLEIVPSLQPPPKVWNILPEDIKNCEKLEQFKKSLKTFLFSLAYNCS